MVDNSISQMKSPIRSLLVLRKIKYFLLADVTGYCRHMPDLLTGSILKVPTMDERDLGFPKKIRGKNIS